MSIIVNLDVMLAKRKKKLYTVAAQVGITPQNLSVLKAGRAKAIRFSTLEKLCEVLECQPGDLLAYEKGSHALVSADITEDNGSGEKRG